MKFEDYNKKLAKNLLDFSNRTITYRKFNQIKYKVSEPNQKFFYCMTAFKTEVLRNLASLDGKKYNELYYDYFFQLDTSDIHSIILEDKDIIKDIAKCIKNKLKK